jgi:superfamily II DNA or RNA helicase
MGAPSVSLSGSGFKKRSPSPKKYHTIAGARVKKHTMKEFLDWLKEECLPGIWSKGVQASRSPKSIERTSPENDTHELRFTLTTPERILAYQVTLWPLEQDAHCDCGSKAHPCHHIVAVALAHSSGALTALKENSESSPSLRLGYSWIFTQNGPGLPGKLSLKRSIISGQSESPLPGSLISWIGGVQSGRISGALPPITPGDLKLDELYAKESPSWPEVLRILSELPPISVQDHPTLKTLRTQARPELPKLRIRELGHARWRVEPTELDGREDLQNGLFIRNGILGWQSPAVRFEPRTLNSQELEGFLLKELPRLRDHFEIEEEGARLPEIIEGRPELRLKIEALPDERFSVTATVDYGPTPAHTVVKRDLALEGKLAREIRESLNLLLDQPQTFSSSDLVRMKNRSFNRFPELDSALDSYFLNLGGFNLEAAQPHWEQIQKLIELREARPAEKTKTRALLTDLIVSPHQASERLRALPTQNLSPIQATLRDYQKEGIQWLLDRWEKLGSALLADDMGLGKTLQTLAVLEVPALVIVPSSLLGNWLSEAKKFRPDLSFHLYHGENRVWAPEARVTLTTYSLLRLEAEKFARQRWKCIVLDEAHLIRNPETQAAIAASALQADFKLALTGTPVQNRKRDLASLFRFLSPALFQDETELDSGLVSSFILRRTKEAVLPELPPKTHLEHFTTFSELERTLYESVFQAAKSELISRLENGESLSPLTVFEVLLRSRQLCNHARLITPQDPVSKSSKTQAVLELIFELLESGHSVLVYSQWTRYLDLLQESLSGRVPLHRLDGSTSNRTEVVNAFQTSTEPSVFLLSLHAGGVGLNLVKASHVIFCEPWWNPFVELQAEDRAYRMGQEKPVTIHRFYTENTIEIALRELQKKKQVLGDEVFGSAELKDLLLNESPRLQS